MTTTLLIDGDHVLYQACSAVEHETRWDDYNHILASNAEEALEVFHNLLHKLTVGVGISDVQYRFAFTGANNFRCSVFSGYKSGRPRKPLCYWDVLETVRGSYRTLTIDTLEADDILGIWATNGSLDDFIIVSEDKDLKTIPGRLYRQKEIIETSPEEADFNWLMQTLTGDPTDGYPGCPGIGAVKAKAYAQRGWEGVLEAFRKADLTEDDALIQARCARILRATDWDTEKKEVKLWTPA